MPKLPAPVQLQLRLLEPAAGAVSAHTSPTMPLPLTTPASRVSGVPAHAIAEMERVLSLPMKASRIFAPVPMVMASVSEEFAPLTVAEAKSKVTGIMCLQRS